MSQMQALQRAKQRHGQRMAWDARERGAGEKAVGVERGVTPQIFSPILRNLASPFARRDGRAEATTVRAGRRKQGPCRGAASASACHGPIAPTSARLFREQEGEGQERRERRENEGRRGPRLCGS